MEKLTQAVKVWISEPLELDLRRLADDDGRSLSDYVRVILSRHVYGHRAGSVAAGEVAMRPESGRP